jgi:hypothetical protein
MGTSGPGTPPRLSMTGDLLRRPHDVVAERERDLQAIIAETPIAALVHWELGPPEDTAYRMGHTGGSEHSNWRQPCSSRSMSRDEPGWADRMYDFFPSYEPYGLREIAATTDPIDLLRWVSKAANRSFDSLATENQAAFVVTAKGYFGDGENRAALNRAQELLTQGPHDHAGQLGQAETSMAESLRMLRDCVLERPRPDVELLAALADTLHTGAIAIVLLHETADD